MIFIKDNLYKIINTNVDWEGIFRYQGLDNDYISPGYVFEVLEMTGAYTRKTFGGRYNPTQEFHKNDYIDVFYYGDKTTHPEEYL